MKLLKSLILITLVAASIAAQNAVPPKGLDVPKVITATEVQSLRFRNSLLEIQNLRSQADAMTSRANLLQATLGDQVSTIMKENKIDDKYVIMRSAGGAYILSDDGLLQFSLKETK